MEEEEEEEEVGEREMEDVECRRRRRRRSWHILGLPLLTGIRSCQSLSTCHSSALTGGLSLQIAQIKIPQRRGCRP